MERQEFLNKLGIGIVAICGGSCLYGCAPSSDVCPTPSNVNFDLDLSTQLTNVGDYLVKSGVIVARLTSGSSASDFTALSVYCTHQGTPVEYVSSQKFFYCRSHGSEFSTNGSVIRGPAYSPLKEYTVTISGSTLTVKS